MTALAPHMSSFLRDYLPRERRASLHTCNAYAICFQLLVVFAAQRLKKRPSQLEVEQLNAPVILAFLEHIETKRKNSVRSRNARLAAIHSFFHYLEYRLASCLDQSRQIQAIPVKKSDHALIDYLTRDEVQALLDAPDPRTVSGVRDRAMLHLAYALGLRVSELVTLTLDDLDGQPPTSIRVLGKGRRERVLPLWKETTAVLKAWLAIRPTTAERELFFNASGQAMTRFGFEYILRKHVATAARTQPSLLKKHVTPHVLRHTCAMHTLKATGDVRKVALWLGHASVQSTEIYLRADPTEKLETLAKMEPPLLRKGRFQAPDKLMAMLKDASNHDNYED
jgi:integrase/recombinase XerD